MRSQPQGKQHRFVFEVLSGGLKYEVEKWAVDARVARESVRAWIAYEFPGARFKDEPEVAPAAKP